MVLVAVKFVANPFIGTAKGIKLMDKKRVAQCQCGSLSLNVQGEPAVVIACNCTECQKRTGSAFSLNAFFTNPQLMQLKGEFNTFTRTVEQREVKNKFCPHCGSTVMFETQLIANCFGVSIGSFTDPEFPKPAIAAWCESKHQWLDFPEEIVELDKQNIG